MAAESWEGHAANLSQSVRELGELAEEGGTVAVAAYGSLATVYFHFARSAALDCHVEARGVRCPRFHENLQHWGASDLQLEQASFELFVTAILVVAVMSALVVCRLALRAFLLI